MQETYCEFRKIYRSLLKKFGKNIRKKNDIQSFSPKWGKRKKRKIKKIISSKDILYVNVYQFFAPKIHVTFDTKVLASKKSTFSACIDEK